MYSLIFDILTDPLGLPINDLWEFAILAVIGKIAFSIGWEASPGGILGAFIHWTVRLMAFFALWAITYAVIVAVQWLIANWLMVLIILVSVSILFGTGLFLWQSKTKHSVATII